MRELTGHFLKEPLRGQFFATIYSLSWFCKEINVWGFVGDILFFNARVKTALVQNNTVKILSQFFYVLNRIIPNTQMQCKHDLDEIFLDYQSYCDSITET